jgi:3',5'-cyclic AMP phosphodiesterase CpdA
MKIAHISDLHLLATDDVPFYRFLNKRLSGWANLRLKRAAVHRAGYVASIAAEIARRGFDHVVVTGDLTNLALESEFERARAILRQTLALDPSRVTVVPGNHDVYTYGAMRSRRFERYLAPWLESDLPELTVDVAGLRVPVVKLRGDVAVVGLSSAVPRPPFVAAGEIGAAQRSALARVLAHPEVKKRIPVLALHHPVVTHFSPLKQYAEGLRDARELLTVLRTVDGGLIVHGHLHRRVQREVGGWRQIGATSASLDHPDRDRMAGFNVYGIDDRRVTDSEAFVYEPATQSFRAASIPSA